MLYEVRTLQFKTYHSQDMLYELAATLRKLVYEQMIVWLMHALDGRSTAVWRVAEELETFAGKHWDLLFPRTREAIMEVLCITTRP